MIFLNSFMVNGERRIVNTILKHLWQKLLQLPTQFTFRSKVKTLS